MPRFKVGDKVTIRQWEDMEKEYGLDRGGYIPVPKSFTPTMKMYCGNTYTIKNTNKDYYILDGIHYDFSDEMFEESKAPKYWMVKGNPNHPLHDKFIRYMNLKCGNVNKNYYTGDGEYYGFDGSSYNNGYVCVLCTDGFSNNPKLITLEEWDKWFGSEVEDTTEVPKYSYKPKYWIVKRDKSNPLFQKCLNYLNETYGTSWTGNGELYDYYGFDGRSQYDNLESFKNNPKLITLEEWDKWFGSEVSSEVKPEFKVGDEDLVKCKVDTTATPITGVCSDIGTTLTQETLKNVIDKLSVSTTIPQKTATSYIELCDLYKKLRGSGPTEAKDELTSIFTFKKLK